MPDSVSAQVVETMLASNESILSNAPSESQGVALEASAYSISLLMINAVSNQQSSSQLANASVVTTCTEILKAAAKLA
jgi:hypothetical protein